MKSAGIFRLAATVCTLSLLALTGNALAVGAGRGLSLNTSSRPAKPQQRATTQAALTPLVQKWMANPPDARVQVWVKDLRADTNAYLELKIAGQRRTFQGAGLDGGGNWIPTNHAAAVFTLALRREYQMSITCTNTGLPDQSGTAQLEFVVLPPQEYQVKDNQLPPEYTVLTNRILVPEDATVPLAQASAGDVSTNYCTLEIRKERFARWQVDDACNDPRPSPGEGTWLSIAPGRSMETNATTIDWSVSLGRLFDGLAAGRLGLHEQELSRATYQPVSIYYSAGSTNIRNQVELVVTNGDGVLRQVKSCQAFVDIVSPDTNQTILRFYHPSQVGTNKDVRGVYTNFSGTNFVSWTIQNPEPSTTNKLLVIEDRIQNRSTNFLEKTATVDGVRWTLHYGSGSSQREEIRDVAFSGSPVTNRFETNIVRYADGPSAYQAIEHYRLYPWDTELKEVRVLGAPDQVTTYEYYDNPAEDYGYYGYGQIKQITYPDGFWEKRVYQYLNDYNHATSGMGYLLDPSMYYVDGLLRYVFEPDDERSGGPITDSANAGWDNTYFTEFSYPRLNPVLGSGALFCRFSMRFSGGVPLGILNHTDLVERLSGEGPEGPDAESYYVKAIDDDGGWETITREYDDGAGPGLAGHVWREDMLNGEGQSVFCYYDHGQFNSNSAMFVVDTNNHLYTAESITNRFPDHRETRIVLESGIYSLDFNHNPKQEWFETEDTPGQLEDHAFDHNGSGLYKGSTTKKTRIFQGGNLVQTEDYVYDGLVGGVPAWSLLLKTRYYNDSLGRATNVVRVDGSVDRVVATYDYRDGGVDGVLLKSVTDEYGATTTYSYDSLKRPTTIVTKGFGTLSDSTTTANYDACGRTLTNAVSAGSLTTREIWQFDLAGRQTWHKDPAGMAVSSFYSTDGLSVTNKAPGDIESVVQNYLTRQTRSIVGSNVVSEFHTHETSPEGYRKTSVHYGSSDSSRWITKGLDGYDFEAFYERPVRQDCTNTVVTLRDFRAFGHLCYEETYPGFPDTQYTYDPLGNLRETRLGGDYGRITGTDQLNRYLSSVDHPGWYRVCTNYVYLTDNDNSSRTVTGIRLEQLNGFAQDEIARSLEYDADTNLTTTTTYLDRSQNRITVTTSRPATSDLDGIAIYQNGLLQQANSLTVAEPVRYTYDNLGRTNSVTDSLGFTTSFAYSSDTGWLESVTDPAHNTTHYQYYNTNEPNAGKIKCVTAPTGKKTYYSYTLRGELYQTWGDVPYPAEYHYNDYGDLTNLITFRGGSQWSGSTWPTGSTGTGDNTYWTYDAASGALLQKTDALNRATTYSYCTNTGRLFTRSWQRTVNGQLVTVTNTFNDFDDLLLQEYNDGTPNVSYSDYNRLGLPRTVIDARGTNTLVYDHAGRLISSIGGAGVLAGVAVTSHFDAAHGRDRLEVTGVSSTLTHAFGYDGYGRLASVHSGAYGAAYGYVQNSDLLLTTTFTNGATTVLTTSRRWEYGMRLGGIANTVDGTVVSSHGYRYDAANRRTRAFLEDGSAWVYGYNDRDELTSAKRYWGDWTPYSGQQFGFGYDNIGNRKKAWVGGDNQGANLREISYTANSLNQYSSVLTPGAAHIAGIAFATNTVTVNSGAPERRAEWFDREISIANTNSPVWQQVSITAGTVSSNGGFVFPKYNQTLSYDADGNLTNDGVWSYEWDGENRLKGMSMADVSNIPNAQRKRLEFGYDFMGRRFSKVVKTWNGSAFTSPVTNLFVYDGWNLLATLNSQLSTLNSFLWGQDLSGTMTEAGGVGGMLAIFEGGNAHFATYDGNGNVTGLIKQDKSTSARYEYSPYGETLRATGPMASANLFRWSTKLWDDEAGLIIYPSRVLHARFGRWLSRDPEGEHAGLNLFAFLGNSPLNDVDPLGRSGLLDVLLGNSQDNESYIIELKRGETLRSRIQDVVDSLNDLQQFQAGVMDAQGLDIGDLVQSIGATRMALSQNLRGVKSGAKAAALVDDMHHIFPKASGLLKFFNANKIDPNGALIAINGYMHRYGLHGRSVGGGIYNEIWEEFAEKNAEMKNNPWYVIGFGFGLFDRVAPLLL